MRLILEMLSILLFGGRLLYHICLHKYGTEPTGNADFLLFVVSATAATSGESATIVNDLISKSFFSREIGVF